MDLIATHPTQTAKLVHLANEISVTQIDCMLKQNQVERAFLGIILLFKEESEGMRALEESTPTQKPKWD